MDLADSGFFAGNREQYLRDAFDFLDKDGDRQITTEELGDIMRSLGQNPNEAELREIMKEVDKDDSGTIEYEEFALMMDKKMRNRDQGERAEIEQAFGMYDVDGKGFISTKCLRSVMLRSDATVTNQDIDELIKEAD
jgi:calmodulin